jgi:putative ATP-dependent endonuclease of OLD family
VFLTTHSPVALRELSGGQLFVLRRGAHGHEARLVGADNDIQSTIRLYPEAFLAGSVVVCEGASEIGLLRGLDLYRLDQGNACPWLHWVWPSSTAAAGSRIARMPAPRPSSLLGYRVMVVRDDDKKPTPAIEQAFVQNGGAVVAYRAGRALEDELFGSLTPAACQRLINYANDLHGDLIVEHLRTVSNNTLTVPGRSGTRSRTPAVLSVERRAISRSGGAHPQGRLVQVHLVDGGRGEDHRCTGPASLRSGLPCTDGPGIRVGRSWTTLKSTFVRSNAEPLPHRPAAARRS